MNATLSGLITNESNARIAADSAIVSAVDNNFSTLTTNYMNADNVVLTTANTNIESNATSLINSMNGMNTTLTTNINAAQESATTANVKADAIADYTTATGTNDVSSSNGITNVTLKAIDASNALANEQGLGSTTTKVNELEGEQTSGSLFVNFFNKLFK